MSEVFPMYGGDGTKSYTKNSNIQKAGSDIVKEMIDEAIADKFDVLTFFSTSKTIKIADLGCSVGPNTFFAMKNVLDSIYKKCRSQLGQEYEEVEYQVFFNDHASNDFNTLFTSLPPDRKYYAAGVPGSFYDRLFPSSSLHLVYSSFALNWLTRVPSELVEENSPAWNKGKIHYGSGSNEVANAYSAQFAKDMETFLNARAKEMVAGGLIIITMPGLSVQDHRSEIPMNVLYDFLGSNLMDMVDSGMVTEAQIDSFNLPIYSPTVEEMTNVVGKNGCFSIIATEVNQPGKLLLVAGIPLESVVLHIRSASEKVFKMHFGQQVVDELFERASKKIPEISEVVYSSFKKVNQIFVVLKRK